MASEKGITTGIQKIEISPKNLVSGAAMLKMFAYNHEAY